jgi:hypothetical protein
MNDVFSKLAELENIQNKKEYYVYYNPVNGDVIHIKNYFDPSESFYPFIKVPIEEFKENFSTTEYVIINKPKLIKREFAHSDKIFDDYIYRIMKKITSNSVFFLNDSYEYDCLIEQDLHKREFRFRLSEKLRSLYNEISFNTKSIQFYLTDYNDPNIIYDIFNIDISDMVKYYWYTIPFRDSHQTINDIFTVRYFQNYLHIHINNE